MGDRLWADPIYREGKLNGGPKAIRMISIGHEDAVKGTKKNTEHCQRIQSLRDGGAGKDRRPND